MHPLLQPRPTALAWDLAGRLVRSSHRSLTGTVLFEGPRTRSGSKFWSRSLPPPPSPARLVAVHLTADETTNATLNKCTAGVLILRTWRLHYGPREFSETRWLTRGKGGLMASGYGRYSPLSISSRATSAPFSYALSLREQDIYEGLYRIFRSTFRWWKLDRRTAGISRRYLDNLLLKKSEQFGLFCIREISSVNISYKRCWSC